MTFAIHYRFFVLGFRNSSLSRTDAVAVFWVLGSAGTETYTFSLLAIICKITNLTPAAGCMVVCISRNFTLRSINLYICIYPALYYQRRFSPAGSCTSNNLSASPMLFLITSAAVVTDCCCGARVLRRMLAQSCVKWSPGICKDDCALFVQVECVPN